MDLDRVARVIRDVADTEIRPRFRALADADIQLKAPEDYVTAADHAAELALAPLLRAIIDVPVVGEEAAAADPDLPLTLADAPAAWVVDPVDGTWNFVHGVEKYAVMVAFVEEGRASAGWIYHPETGDMYAAEAEHGARLNGHPIPHRTSSATSAAQLNGMLSRAYLPAETLARVEANARVFAATRDSCRCAGWDYPYVLNGVSDFLLYWRTKPWDHAPGAVIMRETGIRVARLDGADYLPGTPGEGLLVAPESVWGMVRDTLLADGSA